MSRPNGRETAAETRRGRGRTHNTVMDTRNRSDRSEGLQIRDEALRDDDALDLTRALEDVVDLDVAEPLLEELVVLSDRALGAADLDRLDARADGGLAGHRLAHRRLLRVRQALIGHPGRAPGERARRLEAP